MERGNEITLQTLHSQFNDGNSISKRLGIPLPPSHPNSTPTPRQTHRGGPSHNRSLSQSAMPSVDCLPPLSPLPRNDCVFADVSVERGGEGLPPRKRGHRRSNSDSVPLGFSAMIQSSPQLIPIASLETKGESKSEGNDEVLNSYMNLDGVEDSWNSGNRMSGNDCSDNEVESRVKEGLKRSAIGDIESGSRHFRSRSMDSFMGSLGSLQLDDDFLMSPLVGTQDLPSGSIDGNFSKMKLELGNGEFSESEMRKIAANEKLTEIALADPKRAKRILANRLSAARSKERKLRYISELEQKVQTLQTEATTLSAQVTVLQRDATSLTTQNNELKFRLQAMEQQAQLKEALNEALVAEVQRLRVTAADYNGISHQRPPIDYEMHFRSRTSSAQPGQHQQQQQKGLQHPNQQPAKC